MNLTMRLLSVTAAVTLATVGLVAAPAYAACSQSGATIDCGHVDALDVDNVNGVVTLDIKTYNPANDDVNPATHTLWLNPAIGNYNVAVPSGWTCVGPTSPVFVFPAGVASSGDDRLWPGWNTEDVAVANRPVTIDHFSVSGPGYVTVYTLDAFGVPTYLLSSNSASGCPKTSFSIASVSPHGHANWAFSATGNYTITLRASVTGGGNSGDITYHFKIGP